MTSTTPIHSLQSKWKLCHQSRIFVRRKKALIQMQYLKICLTLFRMGFFRTAHGWRGAKRPPLPKIWPTYPAMMKLGTVIPYPNKIQKIYESRGTILEFCWHQHFFTGNQQILLYKKYRYRLHIDCISVSFNFS